MRKAPILLCCAVPAMLAVVGCAGTGDETATATTTAPAATAAPATTPAPAAPAPSYPVVGGATMYPDRTIVDNASNSKDHSTLVAALRAADLTATLSGPGPYTVFAPTNNAFGRLQAGTLDKLMLPENRGSLRTLLEFHIVPARMTADDIRKAISSGGGTAKLTTLQGSALTARLEGPNIVLVGGQGNISYVMQADVMQSNGIIHVVNGIIAPPV